jgi:2-iminobutanoate/2-iminopropanoate deaminase
MSAIRTPIKTGAAPAAIGPYSQAVRVGEWLFCSGQVALDPASGELVGGGDVTAETRQVLANLRAVLAAAGCGPERVVKTTVFLVDMDDFAAMNEVYGETFAVDPPARSTVAVKQLPRNARVEIEAIAVVAT